MSEQWIVSGSGDGIPKGRIVTPYVVPTEHKPATIDGELIGLICAIVLPLLMVLIAIVY